MLHTFNELFAGLIGDLDGQIRFLLPVATSTLKTGTLRYTFQATLIFQARPFTP